MPEKKSPGKSRKARPLTGVAAHPEMRGRGPKKGAPNAGRPPDEFKAWMARLVADNNVRKGISDILSDPKMAYDPARAKLYLEAFKFAVERAHGKVPQPVEGTVDATLRVTFG